MKNLLYYYAMFTLALAGGFILVLLFWLVYPYPAVVTSKNTGTKAIDVIVQDSVKSGEYLQVRQNYCKKNNLPASVNRRFLDGIEYQVPEFQQNRPIGCYNGIEYIYVPKALPAGKYHMITVYTYRVNPIRTVTYSFMTEAFTITE